MQVTAEALGLMLPGSALMPATCGDLKEMAYKAGVQVMELARKGIKASDIVTMKSFENAIMVHYFRFHQLTAPHSRYCPRVRPGDRWGYL